MKLGKGVNEYEQTKYSKTMHVAFRLNIKCTAAARPSVSN